MKIKTVIFDQSFVFLTSAQISPNSQILSRIIMLKFVVFILDQLQMPKFS